MKHLLKISRISFLFVAVCLFLSGCEKSDYKKALRQMEDGNLDAARNLLVQLDDYKNSRDLVRELNYRITVDCIRSVGMIYEGNPRVEKKIISSTGADAVVSIVAEADNRIRLIYEYESMMDENALGSFYADVTVNAVFSNESVASSVDYKRVFNTRILTSSADETTTGRGRIDNAEFTSTSKIVFDKFNSTKKETTQASVEESTAELLVDMLKAFSEFLEENKPDVTLKDLGFEKFTY